MRHAPSRDDGRAAEGAEEATLPIQLAVSYYFPCTCSLLVTSSDVFAGANLTSQWRRTDEGRNLTIDDTESICERLQQEGHVTRLLSRCAFGVLRT
jgi:hypothetical protein